MSSLLASSFAAKRPPYPVPLIVTHLLVYFSDLLIGKSCSLSEDESPSVITQWRRRLEGGGMRSWCDGGGKRRSL
eukprot:15348104-Ditylum_brightwellii.AAC.1